MQFFRFRKPTLFSYDEFLPHQPVPSLDSTVKRYLQSCRPVKTEAEMRELEKQAADFVANLGPTLQNNVEHDAWTEDNYLVADWTTKYLKYRNSLLKLNFFGAGLLHPPSSKMTSRAAMMTSCYLHFCEAISSGTFEAPLLQRLIPICARQYRRFHSTSRLPAENVDELKTWPNSRHIAVNYKYQWFIVRHRFLSRKSGSTKTDFCENFSNGVKLSTQTMRLR